MCNSWQLSGQQAHTCLAGQKGRLDYGKPERGLQLHGPQQQSLHLLCLHDEGSPILSLAKAYVRHDDLVINYGGDRDLPFHLQVYWGRRSYPASAEWNAMEWTLAMQTGSLIDPSRLTTTTSGSGAEQVLQLPASETAAPKSIESNVSLCASDSTGCILVRMGEFSYIELIHPQDFQSAEIVYQSGESNFSIKRSVFDCTLEKGVIVRARLFGLWVPRLNDVALLRDAYQALLTRALPLTT